MCVNLRVNTHFLEILIKIVTERADEAPQVFWDLLHSDVHSRAKGQGMQCAEETAAGSQDGGEEEKWSRW